MKLTKQWLYETAALARRAREFNLVPDANCAARGHAVEGREDCERCGATAAEVRSDAIVLEAWADLRLRLQPEVVEQLCNLAISGVGATAGGSVRITHVRLQLLRAMERGGPFRAAEVARLAAVKVNTVHTTLRRLKIDGYVENNDARWSLTEKGRGVLNRGGSTSE